MELIQIDKIINKKGIKRFDHNYKDRLKKSFLNYGQLRPIVVNKEYEIIDGHILFEVLKELKITHCYIKIVDNSKFTDQQIYLELNNMSSDFNVIDFIKYIRDHVNINDNLLDFNKYELENLIKLLSKENEYKKTRSIDKLFL